MARCLIIAEAGVNHNCSLDIALKLCDVALESGADVIKFQTWKTEKVLTQNVGQADYQKNNTGVVESQFDMVKKLELSYHDFEKIKAHCDNIGIQFASTVEEEESLDFLVKLGMPFLKIGSGDVGNISFLRKVGAKGLPVILSTGMSTLADIEYSIEALHDGGVDDITLLHCTTNYPCPFEEVNLRAMNTMGSAFKLPVGYSDHTLGTEVSVSAVALGACVIEKHITLSHTLKGPDHMASIEPNDFKLMVQQIRNVESAMGDGIKAIAPSEQAIKKVLTKRIVASRPIKTGEILSESNICVKRSIEGENAAFWDRVIGRIALRDYDSDRGIII